MPPRTRPRRIRDPVVCRAAAAEVCGDKAERRTRLVNIGQSDRFDSEGNRWPFRSTGPGARTHIHTRTRCAGCVLSTMRACARVRVCVFVIEPSPSPFPKSSADRTDPPEWIVQRTVRTILSHFNHRPPSPPNSLHPHPHEHRSGKPQRSTQCCAKAPPPPPSQSHPKHTGKHVPAMVARMQT